MTRLINFIRKCIYFLLHFISPFIAVLSKISFVLFIVIIGIVALVFNDQANDLFVSFTEGKPGVPSTYMLWFTFTVMLWAHTTWLSTRIIFIVAKLDFSFEYISQNGKNHFPKLYPKEKLLSDYSNWLPRILCLVTYLNICWAYWRANSDDKFHFYPFIVLGIGLFHFFYLIYRSDLLDRLMKSFSKTDNKNLKAHTGPQSLRKVLFQNPSYRTSLVACAGILLLLNFTLLFYDVRLYLRSGTIILAAFSTYTFLSFIVDWAFNRWQLPALLTLVLVFVIFSNFNNNHRIKDSGEQTASEISSRQTDADHFRSWLSYKISSGEIDSSRSTIPIILIASEGGGSRAAYWTTSLLEKLHREVPQLYEHTFMASGVSGGNVGLGIFYSYINGNKTLVRDSASLRNIDAIAAGDYLSNVTYGFTFPDMLQRFLPVAFPGMDRGKFLLKSFDSTFSKFSDKQYSYQLYNSYVGMWANDKRYNKPCLLLNSTHVEKGRKVIFSPFSLSGKYYSDVEDIFHVTQKSVPVSEVMTSCSRFPGILPPGLVYTKCPTGEEVKWGHLVDGGYFENTGVETCLQTKLMMESALRSDERFSSIRSKISIYILSIQILKKDNEVPPMNALYETAPVTTLLNVPFRWMWGADSIAHNMDSSYEELVFNLVSYKTRPLPLGWYLSDASRNIIKEQADRLDDPSFKFFVKENEINMKKLKSLF